MTTIDVEKWNWMMNYCKQKRLSPSEPTNWLKAECEYYKEYGNGK